MSRKDIERRMAQLQAQVCHAVNAWISKEKDLLKLHMAQLQAQVSKAVSALSRIKEKVSAGAAHGTAESPGQCSNQCPAVIVFRSRIRKKQTSCSL